MKTLTVFLIFFSATASFAQVSVNKDSSTILDSTKMSDTLRTTSATPVPGQDALGNCVKLPGDFDRCHDECRRRHQH